jgi:hypothetical protein
MTYQGNVNGNGGPGQSEGYALTGTVLLNNNDQAVAWNFYNRYSGEYRLLHQFQLYGHDYPLRFFRESGAFRLLEYSAFHPYGRH